MVVSEDLVVTLSVGRGVPFAHGFCHLGTILACVRIFLCIEPLEGVLLVLVCVCVCLCVCEWRLTAAATFTTAAMRASYRMHAACGAPLPSELRLQGRLATQTDSTFRKPVSCVVCVCVCVRVFWGCCWPKEPRKLSFQCCRRDAFKSHCLGVVTGPNTNLHNFYF